jgi:hypothetical protein
VSPPSAWQPWAEGSLAERALEAVHSIADELPQAPGWLPEGLSAGAAAALRASLAAGQAGQALLDAYLFFDGHGERHADRALELLDEATEAVAATPMTHSLYSGFPGIAWVTDHLRGRLLAICPQQARSPHLITDRSGARPPN